MAVPSTPVFVMNFTANNQAGVVLEKLWTQRETGQFCDIVLHVKGQKFDAHKNVLAACSPYFDSLLKTHSTNDELLVMCQSLQAFQFFLKFLYTGAVSIDETNVSELLVLACHFDLEILKNYCIDYLKECMDISNCLTVLEMAIEYGLPDLRKHVDNFILENIVEINGHSELLKVDYQRIKSFLDAVNTIMPQYILLDFICKWVEYDVNHRGEYFESLLVIVNWQCVECKFLENLIQTCSLFKKDVTCLDTLFSCLEQKEVDLTPFRNAFNKNSVQEHLGNSPETTNVVTTCDKEPSETTSGLFKSLLGYSESIDTEKADLNINNHLNIQMDKPIASTATESNSDVIVQKIKTVNDIVTPDNVPPVEDEQLFNGSLFSEETGLFINSELLDTQSNDKPIESDKANDNTPVPASSENLNVLAEVTELFSNYSKRNIKLSGTASSNVSVMRHVTPSKPTTKTLVGRPAIHYLSRETPFKEKSANEELISTDHENQVKQEPITDLPEDTTFSLPGTQVEAFGMSASDMSSDDSQSNDGCFYDSTEADQTRDFGESEDSSQESKGKIALLEAFSVNPDSGQISFDLPADSETQHPSWNTIQSKKRARPSNEGEVKYCLEVDDKGNIIPKVDKQLSRRQRSRLKWQKGVKCESCSFIAHSPDSLNDHLESFHGKDVTLRCTVCDFSCKRRRQYTVHVKTHFPGPPYHCDLCSYNSHRLHRLLTHRTIHTGERPFKCTLCNRQTTTKSALDYHMRSHTGEKPYECEVCHRTFAMKSTLEQHFHSHESGRQYVCDKCDFTAKYKSHFLIHQRIHRGVVFQCEFEGCDYSTPAKHCYVSHRRMHLNERPYLCGTCGKSFIESGMLVRHERVHMDVRLFFHCDKCEYMTRRRDGLKEHVKKYHSENSKTIYKPRRKSNTATSANNVSVKRQTTTRKSRPPVKRKLEVDEAISNLSSETNTITPLIIAEQNQEANNEEVAMIAHTLNEGQGPVMFLQILPTSDYETVTIEEVS